MSRVLPYVVALAGSVGITIATGATPAAAAGAAPHVMVIVEENSAYDQSLGTPYVVNNPNAPYINNTLISKYTSATSWYSVEHVSDYDYYDLLSGADQQGRTKPVSGTTFVDQLAARNISWKAYMESMPSACYTGGATGDYVRGHNPFVGFQSIVNNPAQCRNDVPYTQSQMTTDLNQASPPSFVWITPNQCNDMHSGCAPTNNVVKQGDNWLSSTIPAVQATQWYQSGGIIIVTWDESVDGDTSGMPGTADSGGRVPTIVISGGNHGPYGAGGDHFGTLHGLQNAYGVGCLAGSCQAGHGDLSGAFPGSISGTVTSAQSGQPITTATVTCAACPTTSATTDGNGGYSFSNVPGGTYSLSFSAPSYVARNSVAVSVSAGQGITQNEALTPVSSTGSITGKVTAAQSGQPIAGATVTCAACPTTSATSDGGGAYTFAGVPAGGYSLSFSASGYVSKTNVPVTVTAGKQSTQNVSLAVAPPPGSVTGTVTSVQSGQPISSATVACAACPTTSVSTDGSGMYTLSAVPPGSYSLSFSASGYVSQANVPVTVTSGQQTTQNAALVQDGSITGAVTDSGTGQPIAGAIVTCASCPITSATTDGLGAFTFSNVPPGGYSLSFSASGYSSQNNVAVTVAAGQPATQNAVLTPAHVAVFSDGFESGTLSAWTSSSGLTTEGGTVHGGGFAVQGTTTGSPGYAQKTLPLTYSSGYERVWFDLVSQSTQAYVLQANTAANANVAIVYVNSKGNIGLQAAGGTRYDSTASVVTNTWHELELRFTVNGNAGSADVWLDGVDVLSVTGVNLKTAPVGVMQIGDTTAHSWTAFFDDGAFDNQFIP